MMARQAHVLASDKEARRAVVEPLEARGFRVLPQPRPHDMVGFVLSQPAPVVIDMAFGLDTVSFVRDLRAAGLKAPVVVFAAAATVPVAVAVMRAGADDFQETPVDMERLEGIISPTQHLARDPIQVLAQRIRMGEMQMQVLRLMAEGMSNKETGGLLRISPKTSERHRTAILRKLGLRNSAQVARLVAGLASGSIADFTAPTPGPEADEMRGRRAARA